MPSAQYRRGGHPVSYKRKGRIPVGKCYQIRARELTKALPVENTSMRRNLLAGAKVSR